MENVLDGLGSEGMVLIARGGMSEFSEESALHWDRGLNSRAQHHTSHEEASACLPGPPLRAPYSADPVVIHTG